MIPTWLAATIAVGAVAATYLFCVRPGLKGRRANSATSRAVGTAVGRREGEVDRQLAGLREELRVLRAQDPLSRPSTPPASGPGGGEG